MLVDGDLVVVESAAHRLVRPVPAAELVTGAPQHTARPVSHGRARTRSASTCGSRPRRDASSTSGTARRRSSPCPRHHRELLVSGAGESSELTRELVLAEPATGVLQVVAQAASCDEGGEHPACYLARQDWGVPVEITTSGEARVELVLLG